MTHPRFLHLSVLAGILLFPALASAQLTKVERASADVPYVHERVAYDVGTDIPFPFVVYNTDGDLAYPAVTIHPRAGNKSPEVRFRYESNEAFYVVDAPYKSEEDAEAIIMVDRIVPAASPQDCRDGRVPVIWNRPRLFYALAPLSVEVAPGFVARNGDGEVIGGLPSRTLYAYNDDKPFVAYPTGDEHHPIVSSVRVIDGEPTYRHRSPKVFDVFPAPVPRDQWNHRWRASAKKR